MSVSVHNEFMFLLTLRMQVTFIIGLVLLVIWVFSSFMRCVRRFQYFVGAQVMLCVICRVHKTVTRTQYKLQFNFNKRTEKNTPVLIYAESKMNKFSKKNTSSLYWIQKLTIRRRYRIPNVLKPKLKYRKNYFFAKRLMYVLFVSFVELMFLLV